VYNEDTRKKTEEETLFAAAEEDTSLSYRQPDEQHPPSTSCDIKCETTKCSINCSKNRIPLCECGAGMMATCSCQSQNVTQHVAADEVEATQQKLLMPILPKIEILRFTAAAESATEARRNPKKSDDDEKVEPSKQWPFQLTSSCSTKGLNSCYGGKQCEVSCPIGTSSNCFCDRNHNGQCSCQPAIHNKATSSNDATVASSPRHLLSVSSSDDEDAVAGASGGSCCQTCKSNHCCIECLPGAAAKCGCAGVSHEDSYCRCG